MTPKRGSGRPDAYRLADGTRVASVTTIIGFRKPAPLVRWAYNRGRDGFELYTSRDEAAEAGSITHQWIEDYFHDADPTVFPAAAREILDAADAGYAAFLEWAAQFKPEIVETETPLVSEGFGFAGTLDAVAVIGGKAALFDWKTSNATHSDYIAQVAAYRQLLRERDGDAAPTGAYLLRVGKKFADFHYHSYPERVLDEGWRWFVAALDLYKSDAILRKLAA